MCIYNLQLHLSADRDQLGRAAANCAAEVLLEAIKENGSAKIIFAAAPSQNEMLHYLMSRNDIAWKRIEAFHMDEYIGLPGDSQARFARYLETHCFLRQPFAKFHLIDSGSSSLSPEEKCRIYESKLRAAEIDLVCMGIGENGHLAFNDPPDVNFQDLEWVKIVELEERCRQQQVNDGCFPTLDAVPRRAITLTIPALLRGKVIVCSVPGARKRQAVTEMLRGPITPNCPASILRIHDRVTLFVDQDSYPSL